jgi:alkylation response protein AidB-like acyl-CoA dehydrogenase
MSQKFPTGREEKRTALLAAVESVRETLVAGADEAEAHGTLPQATVQALDDAGLFALKLPAVLGGPKPIW